MTDPSITAEQALTALIQESMRLDIELGSGGRRGRAIDLLDDKAYKRWREAIANAKLVRKDTP